MPWVWRLTVVDGLLHGLHHLAESALRANGRVGGVFQRNLLTVHAESGAVLEAAAGTSAWPKESPALHRFLLTLWLRLALL